MAKKRDDDNHPAGGISAAVLEEVRKLTQRQEAIEKSLVDLGQPASRSGHSPEQVLAAMNGKGTGSPAAIPKGTDGFWLDANRYLLGRRVRQKGVGMGPALKVMADIAQSRGATAEQLENQHGFLTPERYKSEGMKQPDGSVRKAALAEGSGVTGGYVVPPAFANQLLRLAIEIAFVRNLSTVLPMTSRTLTVPYLDVTTVQAAGTTPFLGGVLATWQPEAASINESEPTFRQMELTAWDLVFHTIASNQLLADNAVALDALLTQMFTEAIAWYSEFAFLRGTGAGNSMPLGILNAPATLSVTRNTATTFKLVDAASMMSKLLVSSWDNAVWVMHQSVLPQLIQMVDAGNRVVWLNAAPPSPSGAAANTLPMTMFGLPIYWTEKLPPLGTRGDVLLVDLSKYLIGDRMDLQIDVSAHVRFVQNQLVWRIVSRMDGRPWLNSFVTLADAVTQVSPFLALN